MTPIESFPHLLNEIFTDFNTAASIVISYEILSKETPATGQPDIKLISVNGYKSLTTYTNFIYSLKADLISNLLEVVTGLETRTKQTFLHHAITRGKRFTNTTIAVPPHEDPSSYTKHIRNYWGFSNPRFVNDRNQFTDEKTKLALNFLTRRYAWIWKMTVEDLIAELHGFLYIAEFLPALTPPATLPAGHGKIPVRTSVAALAATARLFFEHQAIALTNKSQFCRLVAEMFSTTKQKEISPKSLKNHFDTPAPEILEYLSEEFGKMMNNSRKLFSGD